MPELPEVETVKKGLNQLIPAQSRIKNIILNRKNLRNEIPVILKRLSLSALLVVGLNKNCLVCDSDVEN